MNNLYIIDASSLLFRSYYAQPDLKNSKNIPTGALYGFTKMLINFLMDEKMSHIVVVFDSGKKNFRHELYLEYKSNRSSTPPDLIDQLRRARELVEALNVQFLDIIHYEADDVIATLCKKYQDTYSCLIISSDKDLMQLVNDKVKMFDSMKKVTYDAKMVFNKLEVMPNQVVDYLSLIGDASDHIPGVKSIGPKTAVTLLNEFTTLENIYNNLNKISKPRTIQLLIEGKEMAFLSKKLVTLCTTVELDNFELEKWQIKDIMNLQKIFTFYEFESVFDKIRMLYMKNSNVETEISEAKLSTLITKKRFIEWIAISIEDNKLAITSNILKKEQIILTEVNSDLIEILSYSHIEKIGANIKAIWHTLKNHHLPKNFFMGWHDLMVLYYSCKVGKEQTYFENTKDFFKHINHFSKYDALNMYNLFDKMKYDYRKRFHFYTYFDRPMIKVLYDMEKHGFKVNIERLHQISDEIEKDLYELKKEIYAETQVEFDINSPKQLSEILFDKMNLPKLKKNTKSQLYSTNVEVLTQLAAMGYNIAHLLLQWRQLFKIKSTYSDPLSKLADENHRIHSTFLQTLTNTGRLSSVNPNLQNIPRGNLIREAFIADNNKVLIIADYSQIELRILASLGDVTKMLKAFKNNEDIHKQTALELFGDTDSDRNKAKAINFGIIYGMSTYGLAQQLKCSMLEAKEYLAQYNAKYFEIERFMNNNIEHNKAHKFIYNIFHRPIHVDIAQPGWERIVMNAPMQSSVADIMKLAMIRIANRLQNGKLILQIHDEIIVESALESLEINKKIIEEEMLNIIKYGISLPLSISLEHSNQWS